MTTEIDGGVPAAISWNLKSHGRPSSMATVEPVTAARSVVAEVGVIHQPDIGGFTTERDLNNLTSFPVAEVVVLELHRCYGSLIRKKGDDTIAEALGRT